MADIAPTYQDGIVEGERRAEARSCTDDLLKLIHAYCRDLGYMPAGLATKLTYGECDVPLMLSAEQTRQLETYDPLNHLTT